MAVSIHREQVLFSFIVKYSLPAHKQSMDVLLQQSHHVWKGLDSKKICLTTYILHLKAYSWFSKCGKWSKG